MQAKIKILPFKEELAKTLAQDFVNYISQALKTKDKLNIALSGGSTPPLFFRKLVAMSPPLEWEKIQLFWVDERCVPPDHEDSNYGTAYRELILPLGIPESSVHRIYGENEAESEASRYEHLILDMLAPEKSVPVFDIILLGMGPDGHTASIFPDQLSLWNADKLCVAAINPYNLQKRVSFSGKLINAARRVIFLVAGKDKSEMVKRVLKKEEGSMLLPASYVNPHNGILQWYLDEEAAQRLK